MSIVRDILNINGIVIGQLSFPDGTSEQAIAATLALYSTPPPVVPQALPVASSFVAATNTVTTSSVQYSVINGMFLIPLPGTYLVSFSGSINTNGASAQGQFAIFKNGVMLPETRRDINCTLTLLGGLVSVSVNSIGVGTYSGTEVVVNGPDVIDVRFASINNGVIGFSERTLMLLKVK